MGYDTIAPATAATAEGRDHTLYAGISCAHNYSGWGGGGLVTKPGFSCQVRHRCPVRKLVA